MEKRELLNIGDSLRLHRSGSPATDIWTVTGIVGEGGACVCYSAESRGKSGRLKEYYPLSDAGAPLFRRSSEGFLEAPAPLREELCSQFVRAYELLEEAKRSDDSAQILNNFIPPYELLWGEGGTVYVWTADDKHGVSFEEYLSEVRKDPLCSPEHKLYNIIRTTATLTDCIRSLHRSGLLHLDIKPSNFMVLYDGEFNINPAGISLFDVNTLYPIGTRQGPMAGTKNYCAPEVMAGRGENRSDIYSIGAMLLRAIVFSADGSPVDYDKSDYDHLDSLLADSPLLRASDTNSNVFLRHTLAGILRKCLAQRPAKRYECCEELLAQLHKAAAFLLPEVAGGDLGTGKRLAVLDSEPQTDRSSAAVLHDLLFRCPPDRNLAANENDIRVLVVGAGTYGQKFMDICLHSCQLPHRRLKITAVSHAPELDKEVYLRLRPALSRFVSFSPDCGDNDSWAELCFHPDALDFGPGGNRAEALRSLAKLFAGRRPHCVFVSLGDDELNRKIAEELHRHFSSGEKGCDVHYVVQSKTEFPSLTAFPVYVNAPLSAKAIHPQLKKWAFNAHLCWMGGEKADPALAQKQFRLKYNLEASLSYALSIPAKLRSVGIDTHEPERAAEEFSALLDSPSGRGAVESLVALEHRRWVLDKVCSGWRPPLKSDGSPDYLRGILRGDMKDLRRRLHPCIVRSEAGMSLRRFSHEQWATPGPWDDGLDELDTVSVTLHRLCLQQTEKLKKTAPLGDLSLMRRRITDCGDELQSAFETYRRCLQSILEGERSAALSFDSCENALKSALKSLSPGLQQEFSERMALLRKEFFPAVWSLRRRDYKENDEAFVLRLPFVLTYTPPSCSEDAVSTDMLPRSTKYVPAPIFTDDVGLSPRLMELTEKLAENVHEVWAAERMREGWVYGEYRDSELKTTPDLVPYAMLPEGEKEYDRKTALETLRLIVKLGYRIERAENEK